MADIFVSYKADDRARAAQFAHGLEREGFSVWWDSELRSGDTFDERIEQELESARCVVVLWSQGSVSSRWVRSEAYSALTSNKIAPARIDDAILPVQFKLVQTADLSRWSGDASDAAWRRFVQHVRAIASGAGEAIMEGEAASAPAPRAFAGLSRLFLGRAQRFPSDEDAHWDFARMSPNPRDLKDFMRRYPRSARRGDAQRMHSLLKRRVRQDRAVQQRALEQQRRAAARAAAQSQAAAAREQQRALKQAIREERRREAQKRNAAALFWILVIVGVLFLLSRMS